MWDRRRQQWQHLEIRMKECLKLRKIILNLKVKVKNCSLSGCFLACWWPVGSLQGVEHVALAGTKKMPSTFILEKGADYIYTNK
jgi:hypothetical protein